MCCFFSFLIIFSCLDFSHVLFFVCVLIFEIFYKIEHFSHHDTHQPTTQHSPTNHPTHNPTTQHPTRRWSTARGEGDELPPKGVSRPGREEVANPPAEGKEGANAQPEGVECEPPPKGSEGKPPPKGEGGGEPPLKEEEVEEGNHAKGRREGGGATPTRPPNQTTRPNHPPNPTPQHRTQHPVLFFFLAKQKTTNFKL